MKSAAACAAAALVLLAGPRAIARVDGAFPCGLTTSDRIVAVGDIHGASDRFVRILQAAKVIDGRDRWAGGTAVLIQTGDVVDRGADSRRALDLLRRLEGEAERAGGRVVALVGNHEVMTMAGDLRYVSAGEYAAFRTVDSEELRDRAHDSIAARAESAARAAGERFDREAFRKRFIAETPLGSIERQIAFGPDGQYGRWLRERHALVMINRVLFVHGGVSPEAAALGCDGLNGAVRTEVRSLPAADPARLASFWSTREDGPLWYRGLAANPEDTFAGDLTQILDRLQAQVMVVGHTVASNGRITTRFGGRVVQIDTGMLGGTFYPGGRASALEIKDGRFAAIYEDGREELSVPLIKSAVAPSSTPARPRPFAAAR
jgi:hypothetical protein